MFISRVLYRSLSNLEGFLSKKDWTGALLYLETQGSEQEIEIKTLDLLMEKLYTQNKYNEVYKLLLLMPKLGKQPDELDYTLSIEVCLQKNKITQALNIFYQSQLYGITLDSALYTNLLSACTKRVGTRNIKWIISCMTRDQAIIPASVLIYLIKAVSLMKEYSLIETLLAVMHKSNYDIPERMGEHFILKKTPNSAEYQSLKKFWNKIQLEQSDGLADDKDEKNNPDDNKKKLFGTDAKYPLSVGLFFFPKESKENLYWSEDDEESDSD
jgi:hypothetical protein